MRHFTRPAALYLLPLLLLCACEQTVDVDTPYVERLVVNGVLRYGEPLRVSISRTLPLDRPIEHSEGWLNDVTGSILVEQQPGTIDRVALVYTGDSSIYTADLTLLPGRRYSLEAQWNGRRVTASTLVPFPVPIDSIWLDPRKDPYDRGNEYYTFVARFRPVADQVYRLAYRLDNLSGGGSLTTYGRDRIARRSDTLRDGVIAMAFEGFLDFRPEDIDAVLHTFDAPYYDFYQTYYLNNDGDGAFSGGSDLTRWNVSGDGIGLFIGYAVSIRRVR